MFTHFARPGESSWRQMMELESRKEVIKEWLLSPGIPSEIIEVLQEMLATTERQLQTVTSQDLENATPSPFRKAE